MDTGVIREILAAHTETHPKVGCWPTVCAVLPVGVRNARAQKAKGADNLTRTIACTKARSPVDFGKPSKTLPNRARVQPETCGGTLLLANVLTPGFMSFPLMVKRFSLVLRVLKLGRRAAHLQGRWHHPRQPCGRERLVDGG